MSESESTECQPCKANIGARMMLELCQEISERDSIELGCKVKFEELKEKKEEVAPQIIEEVYQKVMEKGTQEDKEVAQEIYELANGTQL